MVKNGIRDIFIENTGIPKFQIVIFQRLEFNANFVGDVTYSNCSEVGQTCFRADRRKFRVDDFNRVIPVRELVVEDFEKLFVHVRMFYVFDLLTCFPVKIEFSL